MTSRPGPNLLLLAIGHGFVAALMVAIPAVHHYGGLSGSLSRATLAFLGGLGASYLGSASVVALRTRAADRNVLIETGFAVCAVYGLFFLGMLVSEIQFSRLVLVASFAAAPVAILVSRSVPVVAWNGLTGVALLATLAIPSSQTGEPSDAETTASIETRVVTTAHYNLAVIFHRDHFGYPDVWGGALTTLGADYVLVSGEGELHLIRRAENASAPLDIRTLPYRVPVNRDEFLQDNPSGRKLNRFRTNDVLILDEGENVRILATHHYWKSEEQCFVLRISSARAAREQFRSGTAEVAWKTVHETAPCLPYRNQGPFPGHESGGRMVRLDEGRLLFSVGHHLRKLLAQDPAASYGKLIEFDLTTHEASVFSIGHRNPQGLYIAPDGAIWSSEHGPQGGDELNRIRRGANYGWPIVTYGTNYGSFRYKGPMSDVDPAGLDLAAPVYSWVPSIATSNLIGIEHPRWSAWQGDLLLAALEARTLFRMRVRDERVVYSEPIAIGERIRDVVEDPDGRLVLWTDWGSIVFIEPLPEDGEGTQDAALRGKALFAQCTGCHPVADGTQHGIGPDLFGIVGRPVAGAPGFAYSDALRSLGGTWQPDSLDSFLSDSENFAPGNTMEFVGVPKYKDREALVTYLIELR